jgi:hypothetical protein
MTLMIEPTRTFALVVGVERYGFGSEWDLNGPASDAIRFVRWLLERSVPAENIRLHLSTLPENDGLKTEVQDIPAHDATLAQVKDSFEHWLGEKGSAGRGDLLLVFWGGHGVLTDAQRRLVFCEDASELRSGTLDLDTRLEQLRKRPWSAFQRQAGFVDTCANYFVGKIREKIGLEETRYVGGTPDPGVRQWMMYAAASGEVAANFDVRRTGAFSEVVLEELDAAPAGTWPPDLNKVHSRVSDRMRELRESGQLRQTPVFLKLGDWEGNEWIDGEIPVPPVVQESVRVSGASVRQYRTLVEVLGSVPGPGVTDLWAPLLDQLPEGLRERLQPPPGSPPLDSLAVVAAAFEHDGGACLLRALAAIGADSVLVKRIEERLECSRAVSAVRDRMTGQQLGTRVVLRLYHQSAPDRQRAPTVVDLEEVLENLWDMAPREAGGLNPLLEFTERAARLLALPSLSAWLDATFPLKAQLLENLRQRLDRETREAEAAVTRLVVDIADPPLDELEYWVYEGESHLLRKGCAPCSPTPEGVETAFLRLISELDDEVEGRLEVELFLPFHRLGWEAEELVWRIGSDPIVLGNKVPVLLRWRERAQRRPGTRYGAWRRTANRIRQDTSLCESPRVFWLAPDRDHARLGETIEQDWGEHACVGFLAATAPGPGPASKLLSLVLHSGAPFALWSRKAVADWQAFQGLVESVAVKGPLHLFPSRVTRELRQDSRGRYVALLWDDPERNPFAGRLEAISQREA